MTLKTLLTTPNSIAQENTTHIFLVIGLHYLPSYPPVIAVPSPMQPFLCMDKEFLQAR
jgi:hypothetical protein